MPLDNRRLPVPDDTVSPHVFLQQERPSDLVNCFQIRSGKRKPDECRPIFLRVGVNSNAKGSAYIEMGNTKLMCSVFGPREVAKRHDFSIKGQLYCQFKFATFSCQQRRPHMQDLQEKELTAVLKEALEPAVCLNKFPKSTVDVFVLVLENDGSALAGAITCAGAAIADAGIDMYDVVVGCSLRQNCLNTLIDPTADEEYNPLTGEDEGTLTVGYLHTFQQVVALLQDGCFQPKTIEKGIKDLIDICQSLYVVVQQCLLNSVKQQSSQKSEFENKDVTPPC